MTVGELMELLEGLDPETEVRVAQQPSWPMEYAIASVMQPDEDDEQDDSDSAPVVYLVEGTQVGYLPGHVASSLGWK